MTGDIIQHYGRLDILVNNAGIVKDGLDVYKRQDELYPGG